MEFTHSKERLARRSYKAAGLKSLLLMKMAEPVEVIVQKQALLLNKQLNVSPLQRSLREELPKVKKEPNHNELREGRRGSRGEGTLQSCPLVSCKALDDLFSGGGGKGSKN